MKTFAMFAFRVALAILFINLVLGIAAAIVPQFAIVRALINNPASLFAQFLPNSAANAA